MKTENILQLAINQRFWEAYENLLKNEKIKSNRDFCEKVGLNEGNFQKYYNGDRKVNNKMLVNMTKHYNVTEEWLLNGIGSMFYTVEQTQPKEQGKRVVKTGTMPPGAIPLYDIDINAGNVQRLIDDNDSVPLAGWLHLEDIPAAAGLIGVRAKGDSMATFINGGDIMLIRRIEDRDFVPPGHAYVVISSDMSVVKYVRNGSTNETWTLRSHNDFYEDFEVKKKSVKHLFIVVKVLKELTY